jgi:IgA peptidase M64
MFPPVRLAVVGAGFLVPLLAGPVAPALAQQPPNPLPDPVVHVIQETGPASERMNLIVLGDGYQQDQQSLFLADVDRNLAVMWATEPYRSYRNYMNVYAVEIASIDYGVRRDPDGRVRHPDGTIRDTGEREGPIDAKNTALRLWYSDGLTNPLARGTTYGPAPLNCEDYEELYPPGVDPCETGDEAHDRIVDTHVVPVMGTPQGQNVQTLAIFNSFTYGGIGGSSATASGGSPQGPLISLHELGHSHGTLVDEYPYSSRDVIRDCLTGQTEAQQGFHHTLYTDPQQMVTDQAKWWRWVGEESLSGGTIGTHEGGRQFPCGVRRPSEHSIMRWLGNDWDQIGREHMVARITGQRNRGRMSVAHPPEGTVPRDSVLWVETQHPKYHELDVTWRAGGPDGEVLDTGSRNLDLARLDLASGTLVHVEVRDPVGPDGIDWVRNPSTGSSATDSGYNGPRFVQTRQWTVGDQRVEPSPVAAEFTLSSATDRPVGGDEVVYVETNHPADRVLDVAWRLDGQPIPNPTNSRNLDLAALDLAPGTYTLTATVTDPAGTAGDTIEWVVDNVLPAAPRALSEPLTTLDGDLAHPVYFDGWDMFLAPQDDLTGYDEPLHVVGQFRLDQDGWFNYFGFPEQQDAPFRFRHSGLDVKALTYGSLGTGGMSRATFEQTLPDDHPSGGFIPGFGTHLVEHRAIDPAGNVGEADSYRATVLPGELPACTTTLSGTHAGNLRVTEGVTCLVGATVNGGVTVRPGASLVARDSSINGRLVTSGAEVVQLFGTTVNGVVWISGTTVGVTAAGSTFHGAVTLLNNDQLPREQGPGDRDRWDARFMRLAFEYGPILAGNTVDGALDCRGNSAPVRDFDASNNIEGSRRGGDCAGL